MNTNTAKSSLEENFNDLEIQRQMKQTSVRRKKDLDLFEEIICLSAMVQSLKADKTVFSNELQIIKPSEDVLRESREVRLELDESKTEIQYLKNMLSEIRDQHTNEIKILQRTLKELTSNYKPSAGGDPYKARRQEVADLSEKLCKATIQRDELAKQTARTNASLVTLQNQLKSNMKERDVLERRLVQIETKYRKEKLRAAWIASASIRTDPTAAGRKQEFQLPANDNAIEISRLMMEEKIISQEDEAAESRKAEAQVFESELQQLELRMKAFAESGEFLNEKFRFCSEQNRMLSSQTNTFREEILNASQELKKWEEICERKDRVIKALGDSLRARYLSSNIPLNDPDHDLIQEDLKLDISRIDDIMKTAQEDSSYNDDELIEQVTADITSLPVFNSYERKQMERQQKVAALRQEQNKKLIITEDSDNQELIRRIRQLEEENESLKEKHQNALTVAHGSEKIVSTLQNQIKVLQESYGNLYNDLQERGITHIDGQIIVSDPCIS
eukprot:GDKK01047883.1.p1 GENE.GDKK01047883.1~~GDKK01047883.1.p1  ORF type:complete len:504 (-),score=117.55 GDKK01047883.1:49-1560(-)